MMVVWGDDAGIETLMTLTVKMPAASPNIRPAFRLQKIIHS